MNRRPARVFILLALILGTLALAGCGAQFDLSQSSMTAAQRDSAIATSDIPGARGVNKAFKGAQREADLNARLDSL
jgi:hypothetical protein